MEKMNGAIVIALVIAYVAVSTDGVFFKIFLVIFFLSFLFLFWRVKPSKKEKGGKKITEKDLEDLKEELEEKIKG